MTESIITWSQKADAEISRLTAMPAFDARRSAGATTADEALAFMDGMSASDWGLDVAFRAVAAERIKARR